MDTEQTESMNIPCDGCGYVGHANTWEPTMSPYSDCRCPECGSTNNAHNREYMRSLQEAFKKVTG